MSYYADCCGIANGSHSTRAIDHMLSVVELVERRTHNTWFPSGTRTELRGACIVSDVILVQCHSCLSKQGQSNMTRVENSIKHCFNYC